MANISDYLVLYLPFDEPADSKTAYDYSVNRNDAVVSEASFVGGKVGNAIRFLGNGSAVVSTNRLSFSSDFTISALVKPYKSPETKDTNPKKIGWLVNFSGVDNYIEMWIDIEPDNWYHIALVKNGAYLRYYVNGALYGEQTVSGSILGVSINQDFYGETLGRASVDEFQLYQTALSQNDLLTLFDSSVKLEYYLDGLNLKEDLGVRVSKSSGVIDGLKMKEPFKVDFADENGEFIDLEDPRFEPREITLDCWLKADGKSDFVNKMAAIEAIFRLGGTHRLMIVTNPTKPLVYEVYAPAGIAVDKKWRDDIMIGTFSLKLREPEPVKRVLKHIVVNEASKTCSITLSSDRYFNIYWGDGSVDYDCGGGENITISHTYATNGDYYPIITGVIDGITQFTTNAIIVWNEL